VARMIPASLPPQTRSSAEKRLFHVLREALDDSFTVFHSFDLLVESKQGKFIDGEIDFLIFQPDLGFLVLEVKGGVIRYEGEEGRWYQNDRPMKMSPFGQAEDSKYKLWGFLKKKLRRDPVCTFAHAVCFPDVYSELQGLPSGADSRICITGEQLDQIGRLIPEIIKLFRSSQDRAETADSEQIRQILVPHCEFGTGLRDRIGQAEQVIFRLTENQCRLLDFISRHRRALVEGVAGSGKTVMAVKKARELAEKGYRILLLSYNVMIGEQLADAVSDLENVTATNYHRFCMERLKAAGISMGPADGTDFWRSEVPDAFAALIRNEPLKYDAIIVDEGQDFRTEYWVTITEMLEDNGFFYIFYDPDQNLFEGDLVFPIDKEPFVLSENCRNTRSIFEKLKLHARREMRLNPEAPGGEAVTEYTVRDPHVRRRQLGKILHDLVNNKGLERQRIVILGAHSMNHTCIGDNPMVGNFRISEQADDGPNVIHYHTYMKFKGCEADAVIMIDVDAEDERWSGQEALYTAVSRAKHLLYILYSRREDDTG